MLRGAELEQLHQGKKFGFHVLFPMHELNEKIISFF
jgi:hypothetical protein